MRMCMNMSSVFLKIIYRISEHFRLVLIFAEFATSQESPKIDTAKNTKISRRENIPIYGNTLYGHFVLVFICRIGWECGFQTFRTSLAIFCSFFTSATSDVVGVSVGSGGGEWLTYTFGRSVVGFGVTMASLCVRQRLQQHLTQQSAQQA